MTHEEKKQREITWIRAAKRRKPYNRPFLLSGTMIPRRGRFYHTGSFCIREERGKLYIRRLDIDKPCITRTDILERVASACANIQNEFQQIMAIYKLFNNKGNGVHVPLVYMCIQLYTAYLESNHMEITSNYCYAVYNFANYFLTANYNEGWIAYAKKDDFSLNQLVDNWYKRARRYKRKELKQRLEEA